MKPLTQQECKLMKPLTHVSQGAQFTLRGQGWMNGVSGLTGFKVSP